MSQRPANERPGSEHRAPPFVAFNILEAALHSLVSRMALATGKGVALGTYNWSQAPVCPQVAFSAKYW